VSIGTYTIPDVVIGGVINILQGGDPSKMLTIVTSYCGICMSIGHLSLNVKHAGKYGLPQ